MFKFPPFPVPTVVVEMTARSRTSNCPVLIFKSPASPSP
jgi:hypothetical protein